MSIHIYPVADEREHITQGLCCWCDPDVQFKDPLTDKFYDEPLVVHHSADCRELVEEAEYIKRQSSKVEPPALAITLRKRSLLGRVARMPRTLAAHYRICHNLRVAWSLSWRTLFF